jgi:hypothetical protein
LVLQYYAQKQISFMLYIESFLNLSHHYSHGKI